MKAPRIPAGKQVEKSNQGMAASRHNMENENNYFKPQEPTLG